MTEQLIIEAYKRFSSGRDVDQNEIDFLIKKECKCDHCGDEVLQLYDFPCIDIEADELLCENCEKEIKYETCPVCEDYFDNPEKPEEHRFFISKSGEKQIGVKSGIYQVKRFPFFYGCLVGGFESFFEDAIELVSCTDIEAIKNVELRRRERSSISPDEMCPECFNKYTGRTKIEYTYTDRRYSLNLNITVRGMIQKAKA